MVDIETIYVKNVYDKIAKEFSHTRYKPWTCVQNFLDDIPDNSLIGDIGCGNGKNMIYNKKCKYKGCDFSIELVKICNKQNLHVVYGDVLNIPFKDNEFDHTMCIAVLHHLSTIDKRKKAIQELLRITKKGGKIFILVWSLKQDTNSRRKFVKQENMIDWKDKNKNILCKRYYYVYKKDELESIIPNNVKIIKSFYEKGNYGIIIKK
jgi:SAM-dependent methyltransferase